MTTDFATVTFVKLGVKMDYPVWPPSERELPRRLESTLAAVIRGNTYDLATPPPS